MDSEFKIFYDTLYFDEVAAEFQKSLSPLQVPFIHVLDSESEKKNWSHTIYFCFGLNKWFDLRNLPPRYIVMQFEPLLIRGFQSENYIVVCKQAMAIFEYSKLNNKVYKEYNIPATKIFNIRVGLGNHQDSAKHNLADHGQPSLVEKDVDVLFIGEMTKHRFSVLQNVKRKFPTKNIQHFDRVWGSVRDDLVRRTHIVLNMHTEKNNRFPLETPRLLYLSSFDVHILSEHSGDKDEDARWSPRVTFCGSEFDALQSLFEKNQGRSFIAQCPCSFVNRFQEFVQKFGIVPRQTASAPCTNIPLLNRKWFDPESNLFETLNLADPSIPDIQNFPDPLLPAVSILTLTTLDRIEKWKNLMLWNNSNRVYDRRKLEWIIVVEKPTPTDMKRFKITQAEISSGVLPPVFLFYENKHKEVYYQITEKRNLGLQNCTHNFIDIMDDDDVEIPDALRSKMVLLDFYENKTCVGSKNILCMDLSNNSLFVKKAFFPTESTLTFHKSFASVGFTPSIHGEGSLMVLGNPEKVIDIPSVMNLIALTHTKNVTGTSRTLPAKNSLTCDSQADATQPIHFVCEQLRIFLGTVQADSLIPLLFH